MGACGDSTSGIEQQRNLLYANRFLAFPTEKSSYAPAVVSRIERSSTELRSAASLTRQLERTSSQLSGKAPDLGCSSRPPGPGARRAARRRKEWSRSAQQWSAAYPWRTGPEGRSWTPLHSRVDVERGRKATAAQDEIKALLRMARPPAKLPTGVGD